MPDDDLGQETLVSESFGSGLEAAVGHLEFQLLEEYKNPHFHH